MSKKIYVILIVLFLICISTLTYGIDMDLTEENNVNESYNINLDEAFFEEDDTGEENVENTISTETSTQNVQPQPVSKTASEDLSIETITSIVLIAIGIVLIFLAIAILIRCKQN